MDKMKDEKNIKIHGNVSSLFLRHSIYLVVGCE